MKTAILLAPWTDDTGHTYGSGEEVDLSDEEYDAMRLDGKVANVDKQAEPSHFSDITKRPAASDDESAPVDQPVKPPVRKK